MPGADEYYDWTDVRRHLPEIRVPTLLVQSRDDPLLPPGAIPEAAVAANPHITVRSPTGAAIFGMVEGAFPRRLSFWAERVVARFLAGRLPGRAVA